MGSVTVRNELVAADNKKYKQTTNDDGTVNKDAIAGRQIPGKPNAESNALVAAADAKRKNNNENAAAKHRNNMAKRRNSSIDSAKANASGEHYAPYVDRVREAKDKQKKKLEQMEKRSYYEDV